MPSQRILLAPGGSGRVEQLGGHAAGLEARGFSVELIGLPRGKAERAVPAYLKALGDEAATTVTGGQSFGGRVASLVAAEAPPAALVLFAYPLHAPGRHEGWIERTAHWPRISCPVLLLSGESDPFARIDLLRTAVDQLPNGTLTTYPGVGHGVGPVLDDALDRVTAFIGANT
ncbi:MAG: alpha/beta family hydrolase [Candidatus Limnocylindria bacterium]